LKKAAAESIRALVEITCACRTGEIDATLHFD